VVIDGVRYMANVWTSPGLGWRFIGLIEYDEVMAAATRMTYVTAVIVVLLALVFALVAAAFAGDRQTHRPGQPGPAVDRRRRRRPAPRLQIQGKDETAELAGWFNKFLAAIRQLIQRIGAASNNLQQASPTAPWPTT
jgi:methyl-accepting chemotaxis protein